MKQDFEERENPQSETTGNYLALLVIRFFLFNSFAVFSIQSLLESSLFRTCLSSLASPSWCSGKCFLLSLGWEGC